MPKKEPTKYTAKATIDIEIEVFGKDTDSVEELLGNVEAVVTLLNIQDGEKGVDGIYISCEEEFIDWDITEDE